MFKRQKLLPDVVIPDLKINERASPEPPCSICLGTKEEKSFANKCYHSFCKICLTEWSKVKPECPVCRQPFDRIIYRVKSVDNYEEFYVDPYRSSPLFDDRILERLTNLVMPHNFMAHPELNMLNMFEPYRGPSRRTLQRSMHHHRERPVLSRERPDPSDNFMANRSLRAFRPMGIQRSFTSVITPSVSFFPSSSVVSIGVPSPMTASSSSSSHRQMHATSNHGRNETGTFPGSGESQVRRNQPERPKRHPAPSNQSNHDEPIPGPSGLCPGSGQGKRKFVKVDDDDSDEVLCVGHIPSCTTSSSALESSSSRSIEPSMPNPSSETSSSDDSNDSVVLVVEDDRPPKPPKTPELIDIVSDSDDTDTD